MKIILSPAKKMNVDIETLEISSLPTFIEDSKEILNELKSKNFSELKRLWKTNDNLTNTNIERLEDMSLDSRLTPAILSYEGIAYQYMAPSVFEKEHLEYIESHLYILSGFYGILRPMDGVTPYRLEMQSKLSVNGHKNLYEFWGNRLYNHITKESKVIINLASKEYSKAIEPYLTDEDTFVTCTFGQLIDGKVVQKGTYAKMARGEMIRYMAINNVDSIEGIKGFNHLNYKFHSDLSTEDNFVFIQS